jgi:hypothetical protein
MEELVMSDYDETPLFEHAGAPLLTREALERANEDLRQERQRLQAENRRLELRRAREDERNMHKILNTRREIIAARLEALVKSGALFPSQRALFKKAYNYSDDRAFFAAVHDPETWQNMLALLNGFEESHGLRRAAERLRNMKNDGGIDDE